MEFKTPEELSKWAGEVTTLTEKLKTDFDGAQKELIAIKAENERLNKQIKEFPVPNINPKPDVSQEDSDRGRLYRWGRFLQAAQKRNHRYLDSIGAKAVREDKAQDDVIIKSIAEISTRQMDRDDRDIIGKADQGTPLSGDAGGTNWQYAMPAYIYEETILRTLGTASEVIPLVQQFPMRGRVHRWPVEGSVKMSWGTYLTYDTSDKGEVVPSITYKDVTSYTWGRYVGVADELLDDTFLEIAAVLRDQAIKTLKVLIEQQLLNAASPNTGALTATTNRYTMGGAGFQDINYDECIAAMQELATQEYRQGTVYIMHPTVWDVIATDKDAVGRYYWNPDMVVPRSIRGTPVYVADGMPDIDDSAVSTPFVLLVDPKTILYGVRMGMAIRFFDATIYAVTNDESFWRFMTRFGTALGIVDKCIAIQTKA